MAIERSIDGLGETERTVFVRRSGLQTLNANSHEIARGRRCDGVATHSDVALLASPAKNVRRREPHCAFELRYVEHSEGQVFDGDRTV